MSVDSRHVLRTEMFHKLEKAIQTYLANICTRSAANATHVHNSYFTWSVASFLNDDSWYMLFYSVIDIFLIVQVV